MRPDATEATDAGTTVVPLAVAWQLHCGACGEPVRPMHAAEPGDWSAARSFTTRLRFTLQRRASGASAGAGASAGGLVDEPVAGALAAAAGAPTAPRDAALISGSYSVSYNAARCTLMLTGSLEIDGQQYFVDDVLTLDLAGADRDAGSRPGLEAPSLPIERLAGLAVLTHLGLRETELPLG